MVFFKAKTSNNYSLLITVLSNTISSRSEVKYQGNARVVLADTSTGRGGEGIQGPFVSGYALPASYLITQFQKLDAGDARFSQVDGLVVGDAAPGQVDELRPSEGL